MGDAEIRAAVGRAQALEVRGEREAARTAYLGLWEEATRTGDRYVACIAAHFLAHAHDAPEAQLDWHLRALHAAEAADATGDARVRAFYPSLHANLADVYLRRGDRARAEAHVGHARDAEHLLADDAYGRTVRSLIARLARDVEGGAGEQWR